MDRTDDSASREERSQNREPEGREHQPHVPRLQHAALFLHHHRVQESRTGKPRHKRGILDRVPSPVTAPAQHRIRPVRAQEDSDRQETPGHHRPAARDVNPLLTRIAHDQRAHRECEGNSESDVAQIQHGRVNHHLRILKKRIQSAAVRRYLSFENGKGVSGNIQKQQKENLHCRNHNRCVRKQTWVRLVAQAQDKAVGRQQQRPEQQRAFLPGPQHRKLVRTGKVFVAVVKNVRHGEVVGKAAVTSTTEASRTVPKAAIPARRAVSPSRSEPGPLFMRANAPTTRE